MLAYYHQLVNYGRKTFTGPRRDEEWWIAEVRINKIERTNENVSSKTQKQ